MIQRQVTFSEAIERGFHNYCNFTGRASRSEYWWWVLFTAIIGFAISFPLNLFGCSQTVISSISGLASLALFLPGLGLSIRRLHDINKSGWWVLLSLIPVVGAIILIVWFIQNSDMVPNAYGPVPNLITYP